MIYCPDVRRWQEAWYSERGMPGERGGQGFARVRRAAERGGQKRKRCVSDDNEERSETTGRCTTPKCKGLAVRESEIRHGEFCVDQFQHLSTNFVHRDIEYFADGMQFGELIRRRGKQDFFELLVGIFHHRRPFHCNRSKSVSVSQT
jgi:hypothetical protein